MCALDALLTLGATCLASLFCYVLTHLSRCWHILECPSFHVGQPSVVAALPVARASCHLQLQLVISDQKASFEGCASSSLRCLTVEAGATAAPLFHVPAHCFRPHARLPFCLTGGHPCSKVFASRADQILRRPTHGHAAAPARQGYQV